MRISPLLGLLLAAALLAPRPAEAEDPGVLVFREQVRPMLTGKCLACHGADKKKGGLDLSGRASALTGGEHGPALTPGKPDDSRLIAKVAAGKMPPGNPLSAEQVAAFRKWVEAGAPYEGEPLVASVKRAGPDWWSLQPVQRPPAPHSKFDDRARNPVDAFLFEQLEKNGLEPSPLASRLTLLRRVTFDLTGLPPTLADIDAFLADDSAGAYEKVVDRLLASPAYGERWGRHWLDVVRFGESHGYEQNHLRDNAWPYRDYVIAAFNNDLPYDRFLTEQLAGDVLAKDDPQAAAATGFLVAGVHDTVGNGTEEGKRQQRANDLDDDVSTIGAAFLGLTVNCAKCHDHKFDPIPQRDYYRLAAVVAGVQHGERPLSMAKGDEEERLAEARRRLRLLQGKVADLDARAREAVLRARGVKEVPRPPVNVRRNVEDFEPVSARFVRFTVLATTDGAEPCLDELEVFGPDGETNLALASRGAKASASSLLPGYPIHQVAHLNDGKFGNEWSWISNEKGGGWAQVELPRAETVARVVWARDSAGDGARYKDRLASRYTVEVSEDGKAWKTVATGDDRAKPSEQIATNDLRNALTPQEQEQREKWAAEIAELAKRAGGGEAARTAYVGTFTTPHPVYVLERGDVMKRGAEVTPGALSQLPGLSGDLEPDPQLGESGRRLALARWLCDPKNPLVARVLVNRVWQYHFGRGLVGTPSDFGFNGERPTHPELLDWLAADFVEHGWRLKRLHRLLVTSAAYRQASDVTKAGEEKDAGNRLLWRMPLRRLEAEAVRDGVLAASGTLDRAMGGPGFRLFKYTVVNVAIYEPLEEQGPQTWRRGVYQQAARAYRDGLLASLDEPECAQRAPRRDMTTTPLQALSLFNGAFVVRQAGLFADRVKREAGERPEDQVLRAFRLAFGRPPTEKEQKAAAVLVERQGLAALCRALLNANEFLYY
jgi:mono/diheme cytochrome c family protein